jgi:hypothetical protein
LLHFALDNFSAEVMAWCSLLGEVAAANVAEAENVVVVENVTEVAPSGGGDEVPMVSGDEVHDLSGGKADDSTDDRASDNENSQTYYFGASTITLGRIREMEGKGTLWMAKHGRWGCKQCQS